MHSVSQTDLSNMASECDASMALASSVQGRKQLNRGGATRHALKDRKDDLYETPAEATNALLRHEATLGSCIWEPACGPGAIVALLRAKGKTVIATDLVDYGCPSAAAGVDFLMEHKAPPGVHSIVTNPPFKLADEFVRKGLELVPTVVMLLRLAFLEGACRADLHRNHLERVWIGAERLPMMHRAGWQGPKNGNAAMPFAWFVFRQNKGNEPATIKHISWRGA